MRRRPGLSVRLGSVLVASATLLAMSAIPLAAVNVPELSVSIASSPVQVTRGLPVAYVVNITSGASNTVNHATLQADTPPGLTYNRGLTTQGTCNAAPGVNAACDLETFPGGTAATVILIYDTSPTLPIGSFNFTATASWGEGPNDQPQAANQDTDEAIAVTQVLAASDDFTIGYIVPEGDVITTGGLFGATALSPANPQGTQATVPDTAQGVPASVGEFADPTGQYCPPPFSDDCFGQVSAVFVGDGIVLDPYLIVQVRFDYSAAPRGLNDRKLVIIHWFDPYPDAGAEEITTICSDTTPDTNELPCRLPAQRMDDRDWLVTIYLESNGFIIGRG
jgi:hypothetical protein